MSSLGLNLTQWTAIAAIGTLALALATTAAVIIGVMSARAERVRDDTKRTEDRQWDSDQRKEDRDRDDQLRREDREESERRFLAEQRDREDYEARQVTVEVTRGGPANPTPGLVLSHRITISAPVTYPIKQPVVQIAYLTGGGIGIRPGGHPGDPPLTEQGYTRYGFWAEIPDQLFQPAPIVSFVDRHGNLYYAYRQQARRFPQNTEFITAAQQIDQWIRTGPKPDEPGA